ncbi:hypothetical protein F5050DRAFT_1545781, partial [Lentinula boryana]
FTNRHFRTMVTFLTSATFYNRFVQLPNEEDPISTEIRYNPKFWTYFANVIGAIDGTHI